MAGILRDFILKTIVGHFLGDREAYMTTQLPGINGYIPNREKVSDSRSSPVGGTSATKEFDKLRATEEFG